MCDGIQLLVSSPNSAMSCREACGRPILNFLHLPKVSPLPTLMPTSSSRQMNELIYSENRSQVRALSPLLQTLKPCPPPHALLSLLLQGKGCPLPDEVQSYQHTHTLEFRSQFQPPPSIWPLLTEAPMTTHLPPPPPAKLYPPLPSHISGEESKTGLALGEEGEHLSHLLLPSPLLFSLQPPLLCHLPSHQHEVMTAAAKCRGSR